MAIASVTVSSLICGVAVLACGNPGGRLIVGRGPGITSVLFMLVMVGVAVRALGNVGVNVDVETNAGDEVIVNDAGCEGSSVGTRPTVAGSILTSGCLGTLPEPINRPMMRLKTRMMTTMIRIITTKLVLDGGCGWFSIRVSSFVVTADKRFF